MTDGAAWGGHQPLREGAAQRFARFIYGLVEAGETALELANALAERAADLRNPLGAEQQEKHHEQHHQLVEPNFSKHRLIPGGRT